MTTPWTSFFQHSSTSASKMFRHFQTSILHSRWVEEAAARVVVGDGESTMLACVGAAVPKGAGACGRRTREVVAVAV